VSELDTRIHVLTLIDHLVAGGGERIAVDIATGLDGAKYRRTFVTTRRDSAGDPAVVRARQELAEAGVLLRSLDRTGRWQLRGWIALIWFMRRERVTVLHAHKLGSNLWGSVLGRIARVPVIVSHEHTWSFEGQPLRRCLDRHVIARLSDVLVAVSDEDRRRMHSVESIAFDATAVVRNGITVRKPTGKDVRAELGIAADAPVLVSVGMLRPQKAFDVLLRATQRVLQSEPRLRVLIVGGPVRTFPKEPARLAELCASLGVDGAVTFLNRRDDVPDILAAADIGVNSSAYEGTPLSIMEYMAAGLPTVGTAVGGVPNLITDRVHGRLVPAGDAEALAAVIVTLVRDRSALKAMGARAAERQRREFSTEVTVAQAEALYEEILSRRWPRIAR
jgi:glycosyltransferase involved in cell wall biosynthesis